MLCIFNIKLRAIFLKSFSSCVRNKSFLGFFTPILFFLLSIFLSKSYSIKFRLNKSPPLTLNLKMHGPSTLYMLKRTCIQLVVASIILIFWLVQTEIHGELLDQSLKVHTYLKDAINSDVVIKDLFPYRSFKIREQNTNLHINVGKHASEHSEILVIFNFTFSSW